jgi:hypothetical protein
VLRAKPDGPVIVENRLLPVCRDCVRACGEHHDLLHKITAKADAFQQVHLVYPAPRSGERSAAYRAKDYIEVGTEPMDLAWKHRLK